MTFIYNPIQSHFTVNQHRKLANHYHKLYHDMAMNKVKGKNPPKHVLIDYYTMFAKFLYHKAQMRLLTEAV